MKNYRATLSQVMNQLKEKGYNGNLTDEDIKQLNPLEWVIDEIHRFEGNTNPADNSILYAISKKDHTLKTLLINAYGVDAESWVSNFIAKLEN